jgi:hypothetical protein
MNSVEWYSDGQTIFIRFLLSGNPLVFNQLTGTWTIDPRSSYVALMDTNNDNVSDFTITVSKANAIRVYQGASTTPFRDIANGPITASGSPPVYTSQSGMIASPTSGSKTSTRTRRTRKTCTIWTSRFPSACCRA